MFLMLEVEKNQFIQSSENWVMLFSTVTEYEGHALSVLKECELQAFDG